MHKNKQAFNNTFNDPLSVFLGLGRSVWGNYILQHYYTKSHKLLGIGIDLNGFVLELNTHTGIIVKRDLSFSHWT